MAENEIKNCSNCGNPIRDAQSAVERDGMSFCSERCASQFQQRHQNPPPKTPVV
jgi:hypothetical protein